MNLITLTLTDEQYSAIVVGVPGGAPDVERVTAYLQRNADYEASLFVKRAEKVRLEAKGLPANIRQIGLDAEQIAWLESDADVKMVAKLAAAAEEAAKVLAAFKAAEEIAAQVAADEAARLAAEEAAATAAAAAMTPP